LVEEFTKLFLDIARQSIPTKTITVRNYDKPWFNNEIRKEIRLRDRLRKNVFKFGRESDTLKYKKQRNKVNNMKKKAKENFESNLDNILLDNSANPKTYWKIMKMLIKSNPNLKTFFLRRSRSRISFLISLLNHGLS
jgi:hydroxylamine reductase (hybrid-cluster protein)